MSGKLEANRPNSINTAVRENDLARYLPSVRTESWSIFNGFKTRVGLVVILSSVAVLVQYGHSDLFRHVLSRYFGGEAIVQCFFAVFLRSMTSVLTPWHIFMSFSATALLFIAFPLKISAELIVVICGTIGLPYGMYFVFHGMADTQLSSRMSSRYWTFGFETAQNNQIPGSSSNKFVLINTSPPSVIAVLTMTQFMVRMLEISGMDDEDKYTLVRVRNHFLYRVRNSNSLRHKAIAAELLFRQVSELLMKRTAMKIVQPTGPVSTTLAFMEQKFSNRLLEQSEVYVKPLPEPLDPDSGPKLVVISALSLLMHKRLFKFVKSQDGGELHPALQATKHITRFGILLYLCCRYLIIHGKHQNNFKSHNSSSNIGTVPRFYNQ
uniref:Uncharacterized protein n=1 Tax=Mucochytrium quahogii TaxID=96639 RepID=A0A7S2WH11_9STRA|mmetsp:Transcript_8564/g.13895  ORF Transcript_8564/g.13895 Transcript_8564/m.13895 type:complete len:380 (+) Transcript_8564:125-1264(+)